MHQLVGLLCALDPNIAPLQELWDAHPSEVVALRPYVFIPTAVKGQRKGKWNILNRRLRLGSPFEVDFVYDSRSLMALQCTIDTKNCLLVMDVHIDRDLTHAEKETELMAMQVLHGKLRDRTITTGDFNIDGRPKGRQG